MKIRSLLFLIASFVLLGITPSYAKQKSKSSKNPVESQKDRLLKKRNHLDLLNYLIVKNGYTSYLEVGVADGTNFSQVKAEYKVGVDPSPASPATHRMTSDDFFATNPDTFDLIFIDGLHLCEQALKDVENALNCLNPGGLIVMHDCMPGQIEHQYREIPRVGAWTGDVWKAAAFIRMNLSNVHFCVLDMDFGCGVLTPNQTQNLFPATSIENLDWNFYVQNKKPLLNLVSVEDWLRTQ